jgi:hypothetical protein
MTQERETIRQSIRTPRAAAVAGILFALLLISSEILVGRYVPSVATVAPAEVARHSRTLALAMNLRPFSGIAFLWFMGVVRNRLGNLEDRFFATVFLGSGLLYVAMMFIGGAVASAVLTVLATGSNVFLNSGAYDLARAEVHKITSIYATKMAGVFMISSSTIFIQTRIVPRWMAMLGYGLALILLVSATSLNWLAAVFPLWVLLISAYVLIQDRPSRTLSATAPESSDD